jgi:hypothetical protein
LKRIAFPCLTIGAEPLSADRPAKKGKYIPRVGGRQPESTSAQAAFENRAMSAPSVGDPFMLEYFLPILNKMAI